MRKRYLILAAWSLYGPKLACNNGGGEAPAPTRTDKPASRPAAKDRPYPPDNISGFAGVVQISDTAHYSDGFDFVLYSKDSTGWKKLRFSPGMADSAGLMSYLFNYDHNLIVFRCLERKGDYFRVVVDEKHGLQRLISVHEKYLMFQSWPQHLQGAYAVEFDAKNDPLRKSPDDLAEKVAFDKERYW